MGTDERASNLIVAGYADDKAIYLEHRRMQKAAIQAVGRFSAVSGLKLNVAKSSAIALGPGGEQQQDIHTEANEAAEGEEEEDQEQEVAVTEEVRYLGHIAGPIDTKAYGTLTVRLALAELKTNTVAQRALIAGAVIVPKLLYVAACVVHGRHHQSGGLENTKIRVARIFCSSGECAHRVGQARASRTAHE
ncbi:hypothetical protein PF004_g15255 [Phytophthora fragariae]|uniref:Uncharacterized protein n=1 Tax=Phytophthora fragariae TaxID=53985 RepID=A0A6G0NLY7_9STRA|nr:hypothetical protein PF004_g15255 [Phytophthora fragariae]